MEEAASTRVESIAITLPVVIPAPTPTEARNPTA